MRAAAQKLIQKIKLHLQRFVIGLAAISIVAAAVLAIAWLLITALYYVPKEALFLVPFVSLAYMLGYELLKDLNQ